MPSDPHKITCLHHQHTNLPNVSSTTVSLTFQEGVPLQTQGCLGIDQNQDGLNMGAWGMHDLGNQGYVDSRSLPHPSSYEQPAPKSEELIHNLSEHSTTLNKFN
jgi:hypothetical protein